MDVISGRSKSLNDDDDDDNNNNDNNNNIPSKNAHSVKSSQRFTAIYTTSTIHNVS